METGQSKLREGGWDMENDIITGVVTLPVCDQHSGICSNNAALSAALNTSNDNNKEAHDRMWESINNLQNRLPVWATVLIAILTGIIGWLSRT
jgi:hypothetical protein